MLALRVAAWGSFGLAMIAFVLFVNEGFIPFLAACISLLLAGVLLMAADRALVLLEQIKQRLTVAEPRQHEEHHDAIVVPRAAEEIERDLIRIRAKP